MTEASRNAIGSRIAHGSTDVRMCSRAPETSTAAFAAMPTTRSDGTQSSVHEYRANSMGNAMYASMPNSAAHRYAAHTTQAATNGRRRRTSSAPTEMRHNTTIRGSPHGWRVSTPAWGSAPGPANTIRVSIITS